MNLMLEGVFWLGLYMQVIYCTGALLTVCAGHQSLIGPMNGRINTT